MKKIIYIYSIIFLILQSCSNDDNSENSNNNEGILLKKIESSNDPDPTYFVYNDTKLNWYSIGDETGQIYRNQFTYSGDLIIKFEWYENNQPTGEKETYSYVNNKLSETRVYSPGAILEFKENYLYNVDGTVDVNSTGYNGNSNSFVKIFLDSNNNVIKTIESNQIRLFEFDNKNNPIKNITGFDKLNLRNGHGSGNNNLTKSFNPNIIYNFQYNSQNYPLSCEIIRTGQAPVIETYYY
jgi:hypothetical protein